MIHLTRILEQIRKRKSDTSAKSKQLNVLFVGDADTKTAFSYARDILKSQEIDGRISAANVSIEDFPRLMQTAIAKQYDVVCVMFSNIIPSRTTQAEEILQQVYNAAKEFGAKLIAISPTSKEHVPYGHVKYANNEDVVKWVTKTQNISDYTINAYQLTNKKTMFDKDGLLLNREGQETIARQVLRALSSIDPKIDTKAIEKKKEKKPVTKKPKTRKFTGLSKGNKSQDLIEIQRRLVKLGYEIDPAEIKAGKFGETTETAINQFQTINDLPVTGKLSEKDVAAIKATSAKSYGTLVYMAKSLVNKPVEEPETEETPEDGDVEDEYAAAASVKKHASIPKSSKEFFEQWKSVALQHQSQYGIPASITLAQSAIESGFGKSGLTTKYNNFFGITGAYNGKSVKIKNKKGQLFTWRVYPTPEESFEDHASLLSRKYKPSAKNAGYVEWAKSLTDNGYAESNYGTNLIKFIKQNGLDEYDTATASGVKNAVASQLSSQSLLSKSVKIDANGPSNHGSRALGNWQSDNAWDIFSAGGTKVYSITSGVVSKIGGNENKHSGKIFGAQVTVTGQDGYPNIFYTHLTNLQIAKGDTVEPGTLIGEITTWDDNHSSEHVHIGLPFGESISSLVDMATGKIKIKNV
jgi:flagellum-specific peptidoglycan hydrolase FlgJ